MTRDELLLSVLRRLLEIGYFHALPGVRRASKTLAKAMQRVVVSASRGALYIPHYWAVYTHDGRSNVPYYPNSASVFVWFRNPKDDPRHEGIYPERASEVRKLTPEEFDRWRKRNREAIAAGLPPPMIVTPVIKNKTDPTEFFLNEGGGGMSGFAEKAENLLGQEIQRRLIEGIPGIGTTIKDAVKIRL